ncbi:type II toxin-antitoxin system CcdA family antitoxin [Azospirillum doebereinerae]|uniref:Acetoacetyl-CoA synthase n=1 Tax=Azospirillum doebereinerae TaxID=92933 RepID=A0A3S0X9T2_9PROT|nr:type II toxin-antitoxin system CcdA family antitoxin [Azospirillum doebereinerae]RUQ68128.1 hypothetical protein EJ913_18640 [Azospirillum doebereinerae]
MTSGGAVREDASAPPESAKDRRPRLTEAEKQRWMEENREAFAAYDAFVEKHGVFGDEHRLF